MQLVKILNRKVFNMKIPFRYFLLAIGLFCCVTIGEEQLPNAKIAKKDQKKILQMAKKDQIALLEWAMEHYEKNVRDYQGTLYKQERIAGKIGKEEVISFKFKEKPFSIFMQWQKNSGPTDRLLYVEGKHDNKMIVHPNVLLLGLIVKSVKRDPHGEEARKVSLRTCDEFGFYRIMQEMLRILQLAEKNNGLKVKSVSKTITDGRKCVEIEVLLPKSKVYTDRRVIMQIDTEYLMPVYVASFDSKDLLIGKYLHKNLRFNTGLSDSDFTPEANKL